MARSLNKVQLIGYLGRAPELKYTQSGTARATFSVATRRYRATDEGGQEETEWHQVTAWGTLAETCNEFLIKGRLVYIEGRVQTRSWETDDGARRSVTEIIAEDVLFLDRQPGDAAGEEAVPVPTTPARAASGKGQADADNPPGRRRQP